MSLNRELQVCVGNLSSYFFKTTTLCVAFIGCLREKMVVVKENRDKALNCVNSALKIKFLLTKYVRRKKQKLQQKSIHTFLFYVHLRGAILQRAYEHRSKRLVFDIVLCSRYAIRLAQKTTRLFQVIDLVHHGMRRLSRLKKKFRDETKKVLDRVLNRMVVWEESSNPTGGFSNKAILYYENERLVLNGLFEFFYCRFLEQKTQNFRNFEFKKI